MDDLILSILLILIVIVVLMAFVSGVMGLFVYARERGLIGIAVYIASWVFLAPVMAVLSVILGILMLKEKWFGNQ